MRSRDGAGTVCHRVVLQQQRIGGAGWLPSVVAAAAVICMAPSADARDIGGQSRSILYGCWEKKSFASRDNVAKKLGDTEASKLGPSILTLCFHRNGTLNGYYLEPTGEGGDLGGRWRFDAKKLLLAFHDTSPFDFRDKFCSIKYLEPHRFNVSDCSQRGEFQLICRDPKNPAPCPGKAKEK